MKYLFLVLGLFFISCGTKEEKKKGASIESVVSNMKQVEADFAPSSLSSSASLKLSDLCNGSDIFGCQPEFLKAYLSLSKIIFASITEGVSSLAPAIKDLKDGDQGTSTDNEKAEVYSWKKTSESSFEFLVSSLQAKPILYFNVTGSVYKAQFDFDTIEATDGSSGQVEVVIDFVDPNNWKIDLSWVDIACKAGDAGGPSTIRLKTSKQSGVWSGKAMLYAPNWGSTNASCWNKTNVNSSGLNLFTDYIASEDVSRGSVYALSSAISSLENIENYSLSRTCTNFSSIVAGCGGSRVELTPYRNSFCVKSGSSTPIWNDDCSSSSSSLIGLNYGSSADWVLPSVFYTSKVTLPSSI